jgi:hypothetical protein
MLPLRMLEGVSFKKNLRHISQRILVMKQKYYKHAVQVRDVAHLIVIRITNNNSNLECLSYSL